MLNSSVGPKNWAVFTKTDRFSELERDVRTLQDEVKDLKQDFKKDANTYGAIFLCVTATQALILAAGDVSHEFVNKRFTKMCQAQDARLRRYTHILQPFTADEQAVASGLDRIINERNSMVHVKTEAEFYQNYILPAQAMLRRQPSLREKYATESLVIDTYTSLKSCFNL